MPIDILIYAVIAIFLIFQLSRVLGQYNKEDQKKQLVEFIEAQQKEIAAEILKQQEKNVEAARADEKLDQEILGANEAFQQVLKNMKQKAPQFSLRDFLEGAKNAFEMVFESFQKEEMEKAKSFLAPALFKKLKAASENLAPGSYHVLVQLKTPTIENMKIEKNRAEITLLFTSQQMFQQENEAGEIINEDHKKILVKKDRWVLEKDLKDNNPNWMIIDISAAASNAAG